MRYAAAFAILVVLAVPGAARQKPGGIRTVVTQEKLGPFELGGKKYTVVLDTHSLPGAKSDPDTELDNKTVERLRIVDTAGKIYHLAKFPVHLVDGGFEESWAISAQRVRGETGEGLVLSYNVLPSAPNSGESVQFFAVDERDKLQPLSKPITVYGNLERLAGDDEVAELMPGDLLNFSVWTGHFFVRVPLQIDLGGLKIGLKTDCCRLPAEATPMPSEGSPEVAQLFSEPDAGAESEMVRVTPQSRIEYLEAYGRADLGETADQVEVGVSEPVWLRVRIDGQEGWVTGEENFYALRLPMAG